MQCHNPRNVSFRDDGKTFAYTERDRDPQFAWFKRPCGKCLACRLQQSRDKAARCVLESAQHDRTCFVTLTYDDDHLESPKLDPTHFQKFIKDLRTDLFTGLLDRVFPNLGQKQQRALWRALSKERRKELYATIRISVFAVGEYGTKNKRPHFHALLFNWRPSDGVPKYKNDMGDQIYESEDLTRRWGRGMCDFGEVTFKSAAYVARYAAKSFTHGADFNKDFKPWSRSSSANAIGKSWIEKHWPEVFTLGHVVLPDGTIIGIPRYFEDWFKKTHPERYRHYALYVKSQKMDDARKRELSLTREEKVRALRAHGKKGLEILDAGKIQRRRDAQKTILEQRFKQLHKHKL